VLDDGAGLRPGATMWWGVRETLPAGTELELTGFDPNFEDWVYVRTVDGSSVGWTRITDLEINRRLADLPLVTPRPTLAPTSTPTTVPTPLGCETGPLTLDAWGTGTTCHSGGSWSASIFAQGHGGNCMYTYTWEGVVKAGPIPGSMSFEIPGAGAIVGTVFVSSGDETVSGKVYVPAPECD